MNEEVEEVADEQQPKEKRVKTAVDAKRGTNFNEYPDNPRFVLVTDEESEFYDERIRLPVSEEMAESLCLDGQIMPGEVAKRGTEWWIIDGKQRLRAMLLANEWIRRGDPRAHGRTILLRYRFEVVAPEDERDVLRKQLAANLRVDDTPMTRAKKIARCLKWDLSKEEIRIRYGFKSMTSIDNILVLLTLDKSVQKAIEEKDPEKRLPENAARRFAGLKVEEQRSLLEDMKAAGMMKGGNAQKAITAKKQGKKVSDVKKVGKKLLSRAFIEAYELTLDGVAVPGAKLLRTNLRALLGDDDAVKEMPEPFQAAWKKAKRTHK